MPIVNDALDEDDETFTVNLSRADRRHHRATGRRMGTITDDDPLPTLDVDDCAVLEGDDGDRRLQRSA